MAQLSDISINVGITISEETVQRCCQLLAIYLTDNHDKNIQQSYTLDGDKRNAFVWIGTEEW